MFYFGGVTSQHLSAPAKVAFDYTRSTGPVLGRFFTGLRDASIVGARTSDGRVHVPPPEFDPGTRDAPTDFVDVEPVGTVQTWAWVPEPVPGQPLDRPFAFALITLDGADTPLLHAVDVESPDAMSTGMRVWARWATERVGAITDIACFVPKETATEDTGPAQGGDAVTGIVTPVELDYMHAASASESRFLRGLTEGRLLGQRCPSCQKVYIPPREACPTCGVPTTDEVELPDTGIVTTFCIVNVPFLGQRITPPYVSAYVLLDGADIAFLHLVQEIDAEEVRMGMRVQAVWRPREEWGPTIENIQYFRPTGEPDADFETYRRHL